MTPGWTELRRFVGAMATLVETTADESEILQRGPSLLRRLIIRDDWLADEWAQPSAARYQQYLLHCDSRERFSVISFVWGPGQATPVHDHTVWGMVGVLRGLEATQSYRRVDGRLVEHGPLRLMKPGDVEVLSPKIGDIHRVSNAFTAGPSISIHVYGANIATVERSVFTADGSSKPFVCDYSNDHIPNLWRASSSDEGSA